MAKKTVVEETEAAPENKAASLPALNMITKTYEEQLGPYHTIEIPRGKKDPQYLPIQVLGTLKDGRPVAFRWLVQRGVKVHNVPDCALSVLKNAVETSYVFVMKDTNKMSDGEAGHEVITSKDQAYPYMVHESYPTRKADVKGPIVQSNNG